MSASDPGRRRRLIQLASAATFLAIVALAVLIVVSQTQTDGGDTELEDIGSVRRELAGIPQRGMLLGDPGAPVKLVEFGDLQCPACRAVAEEALPEVIDTRVRNGEASVEFRNFTIIGDESTPAGAAALAAGMQGRGWSYLELFYRNQGLEGSGYVTDDFLTALAEAGGVSDIARWNRDRSSQAVLQEVAATTVEAERLGFDGTPSFAVEGPSSGGLEPRGFLGSAEELESAIQSAE
jgi:protein-disulfide isomerase